jgi:hypothetical protein
LATGGARQKPAFQSRSFEKMAFISAHDARGRAVFDAALGPQLTLEDGFIVAKKRLNCQD